MMTSAKQKGSSQVSLLEIYSAEICSVKNCMAKVKSVERDSSIMVKLSSLSKYVGEANRREAGGKIMRFAPLVPSCFPLEKPFDVFLVCHDVSQIRFSITDENLRLYGDVSSASWVLLALLSQRFNGFQRNAKLVGCRESPPFLGHRTAPPRAW